MALRLVEIILPSDQAPEVRETLEGVAIPETWQETLADGQILVRVLLDAEQTGGVVDSLQQRFGAIEGFRLLIFPVEAALPRPEETPAPPDDDDADAPAEAPPAPPPAKIVRGLSREELHGDVMDMTRLTRVYVVTVVLSTVVATIGILRENVAVIVGAMVIAPLLGPNVALAFGTTVGDVALTRRALASNLAGVALALALAVALGLAVDADPLVNGEIAGRTEVGLSDIALALAAGSAGTLAVTAGIPSALVGVMVAVALLPPTVVLGLMIGGGRWPLAGGAAMLLATNVICINLSGVVTFLAQGVRPRTWWEADKARRSTRRAVAIWIALLALLAALIVVRQRT